MRNLQQENVAEHSLMTAILAHSLALIGKKIFDKDTNPDACAAAALFHDAPEILTGDLPTPVKYFTPELRAAYAKVEEYGIGKFLDMLPAEFREDYQNLLKMEDKQTAEYIHAADKLQALIKCKEELRGGNNEFLQAAASTENKLKELNMPEVSYFLENFMNAFEKNLDEL